MRVLIVATSNPGKVRELRRLMAKTRIRVEWLQPATSGSIRSPRESGRTFLENARIKATYYARRLRSHVFSEDSGLCVEALKGAPGIRSARLLGSGATDQERCVAILHHLKGHTSARRRAACFEAAGVIAGPRGEIVFEAVKRCRGWIAHQPRGSGGFGYDPIFYYPPYRRTFGEVSPTEKNKVSHRAKMIADLHRFLMNWH